MRSGVSPRAVLLWIVLNLRGAQSGQATAFRRTLAEELDCSLATLKRALEELVSGGWVTYTDVPGAGGARAYQTFGHPAKAPRGDIVAPSAPPKAVADHEETRLTSEPTPGSKCALVTHSSELHGSSVSRHTPPVSNSDEFSAEFSPLDKHAGQMGVGSPVSHIVINKSKEVLYTPSGYITSPPRAAGGRKIRRGVNLTNPEAALDPSVALTLWDSPEEYPEPDTPKRARKGPGPDTPYGLALDWRHQMDATGSGALDSNLKALASHFKAMLLRQTTAEQIRAMNRQYAAQPGLRSAGVTPWKDFINKRFLLLKMVTEAEEQARATADPNAYYAGWAQAG